MRHMILGLSTQTTKIEQTLDFLLEKKYPLQEVSLIMKEQDDVAKTYFQKLGLIDDVIGSKEEIPTVAVLGVGNIYIGGPIAALLHVSGVDESFDPENTVEGALTTGMVNALMDIGVHEDIAKAYEEGLKAGSILIGVYADSEKQEEELNKFMEEQKLTNLTYLSE
jgi:hypothetical protein